MTANIHNNSVTGITAGDGNVAFVIENSSGNPGSHLYLENFNTNTNTTWNNNANTPANSTLELNSPASAAIPAGHNGGHTILPSNPNALFSASGGVAALNPTPGETNLTQAELNAAVAAAIANWKAAGLSDDKIAQLEHTTYDVADITSGWLGQSTPGHVTVDVNADGHGWYIDPTPTDNSEFGIALSSTALLTDSTTAAAGHIDLVTVVEHEMGEQLGLLRPVRPLGGRHADVRLPGQWRARAGQQHGCRPGQSDGSRAGLDRSFGAQRRQFGRRRQLQFHAAVDGDSNGCSGNRRRARAHSALAGADRACRRYRSSGRTPGRDAPDR